MDGPAQERQPLAAPTDAVADAWRVLRGDSGLRYLAAACLPLRNRAGGCDACRVSCPTDALLFTADGMALDANCIGCGRCVAACPMGAYDLPGARPQVPPALAEASVLQIDCWRVPAKLRAATSVPCLGALDAAALLTLCAHAGERRVEVLDRGWCVNCQAGGENHPAQAALDECAAHLAGTGMLAALWPRLAALPLPAEIAAPDIPQAATEVPMTRRAFFGRLAEPARRVARDPLLAPQSRPPVAPPAHPSLARRRLVDALTMLARQRDLAPPASLFPRLLADDRCRDHQGCTRVCPTGALLAYEEPDGGGARFDAADCIACGLCETHCPEQALHLSPARQEARAEPTHVVALTRHVRRVCTACGDTFSVAADEADASLCGPCGKSQRFAHDMFQQLFGARP